MHALEKPKQTHTQSNVNQSANLRTVRFTCVCVCEHNRAQKSSGYIPS